MKLSQEERQSAWKNIVVFLAFTAMLTAFFQLLIYKTGGRGPYFGLGLSWSPGIAAILTCLTLKRGLSTIKWNWGDWKWIRAGYTYPFIYCALIYIPIWLFGLGGNAFNAAMPFIWSEQTLGGGNSSILGALLGFLILLTLGLLKVLTTALGEEIGWRGFMVWEFRKVASFQTMGIVTGLIWAAWHWPRYFIGTDVVPYDAIIMFTLNAAPLGVVLAYFAIKSKSLWPAAIMHAGLNLCLGVIFGGLNKAPEDGDPSNILGIATAIVSIALAIYYLRRAKKEGL